NYTYPELYLIDPDGNNLRPLSFTQLTQWVNETTYYTATGQPLPNLPGLPALAGNLAAIGSVSSGGADQITLYNAHTGAQLTVVLAGSGGNFSVVGGDKNWVVFHIGKRISALNVHSHKIALLTRAVAKPLNLSLSGRRVAWAENLNDHGRIRALELPS